MMAYPPHYIFVIFERLRVFLFDVLKPIPLWFFGMVSLTQLLFKLKRFSQKVDENNLDSLQGEYRL